MQPAHETKPEAKSSRKLRASITAVLLAATAGGSAIAYAAIEDWSEACVRVDETHSYCEWFYNPQPDYEDDWESDQETGSTDVDVAEIVTGDDSPGEDCDGVTSLPVMVATGNKVQSDTDFNLNLGGQSLGISRFYNTAGQTHGIFGPLWNSNIDTALSFKYQNGESCTTSLFAVFWCGGIGTITEVYAHRSGGNSWTLLPDGSGAWIDGAGNRVSQSSGSWILTTREGGIESYTSAGQPIKIGDERGIGVTYNYNAARRLTGLTHSSGKQIQFEWNQNKVSAVIDPAGGRYTYQYAPSAMLQVVTSPGGLIKRTYHYEVSTNAGTLTGISLNDVRQTRVTYHSDGKVATSGKEGGVEKSTFTYGADYTDVTNTLGSTTRYHLAEVGDAKRVIGVEIPASAACPARGTYTAYDSAGNKDYVVDALGNKTDYTYSEDGQLLLLVTGIGPSGNTASQRITQYVWDPIKRERLLSVKRYGASLVSPISETLYDYYPDGHASARLLRWVKTFNRSSKGSPNQERITAYGYSVYPSGMVQTVVVDGTYPGAGDQITVQYSSSGDLLSTANTFGHAVTYTNHTALGQAGRITSENGQILDLTYDLLGRLTKARAYRSSGNDDTSYVYGSNGQLRSVIEADGHVKHKLYDQVGRLIREFEKEVTGTHAVKEYEYNNESQRTHYIVDRYQGPPGSSILGNFSANSSGVVSGWACSTFHDAPIDVHLYLGGPAGVGTFNGSFLANQASEPAVGNACASSGTQHRFQFTLTQAQLATYANQPIYIHGISPFGASNLTISGSGQNFVPGFGDPDPPGPEPCLPGVICQEPLRVVAGMKTMSSPPGRIVHFMQSNHYDASGAYHVSTAQEGQSMVYQYGASGEVRSVTDSLGRVRTFTHNPHGELLTELMPDGGLSTYTYDIAGNVSSVTDAIGGVTTYEHDGFGQVTKVSSPDTGITTYQYDSSGRVTQKTPASGGTVTYSYDALGRQSSRTVGFSTQTITYDSCTNGKGRVCAVNDETGSTSYQYTPSGKVSLETRQLPSGGSSSVAYQYDVQDRLVGIGAGGVGIGYGYAAGRIVSVTSSINGATTVLAGNVRYQPFGPVQNYTYGNGLSRELTYDTSWRPKSLKVSLGSTVIQSKTVSYNANNHPLNVNDQTDTTKSVTYGYDTVSRLLSSNSMAKSESWTFDKNGNKRSYTAAASSLLEYHPNSNRLHSVSGGQAANYTHDDNGNIVEDGSIVYVYDGFNRMSLAVKNGVPTTYSVNGLGQRVYKYGPSGQYWFIYDEAGDLLGEFKAGQGWTVYARLHGEIVAFVRGAQNYYVHNDLQQRAESVTNSVGSLVWKANNSAYGRDVTVDSIGGYNLGYPGQYFDAETGNWNNGARDYSSKLGRYLQSDPIGLGDGNNTYEYVGGNPMSYVDPDGRLRIYVVHERGRGRGTEIMYYFQFDPISTKAKELSRAFPSFRKWTNPLDKAQSHVGPDQAGPKPGSNPIACGILDSKLKERYGHHEGQSLTRREAAELLNTMRYEFPEMNKYYRPTEDFLDEAKYRGEDHIFNRLSDWMDDFYKKRYREIDE